jgi:hypothetical protein
MRHLRMAGGESEMQVDHFNPTLGKNARNNYANLMLSTGHCNLKKRDYWPTPAEEREGYRLLNPCTEQDYEQHLFENPTTHELVGVTKEGRYHIDVCDLNNETFVWERKKRAQYLAIKRSCPAVLTGSFEEVQRMFDLAQEIMDLFIPEIAAPPRSAEDAASR